LEAVAQPVRMPTVTHRTRVRKAYEAIFMEIPLE
jgi:hypothetical protein